MASFLYFVPLTAGYSIWQSVLWLLQFTRLTCQLYVVDKCLSGEEGWFHFNLRDRWLVLLVSHRIASYQLLIIAFNPYCYYYSYSC